MKESLKFPQTTIKSKQMEHPHVRRERILDRKEKDEEQTKVGGDGHISQGEHTDQWREKREGRPYKRHEKLGFPYEVVLYLLCLLLTMPSYFVVASVVLAVRCAACLLPLGKVGLAPPYLCQVGRMTADPPMLVSGRAQSRRVGHVVGPAVRGRRDVAARSTFAISG
ncbi:hypothetical protein BHM03_00030983 [Ensete ventricosum]|nr:hypothetical protein BHM03_00030983 [Ensete ventricosum]